MTQSLDDIVDLQYFLQAISYFCAASLAWENRPAPDTLIAPVTQLVGHGVELTLKANLLLQGVNKKDIRSIGHELKALWYNSKNVHVRECAYDIGKRLHNFAAAELNNRVDTLSNLYFAGKGQYPLRYEADPQLTGSYSSEFTDTFFVLAKVGVGTSIERLASSDHLREDALKLEKRFAESVWSSWRPKA